MPIELNAFPWYEYPVEPYDETVDCQDYVEGCDE